jgi:NAD(P)-dependent dehydrogenase (short-subunit alcohol dehydrogenase family)
MLLDNKVVIVSGIGPGMGIHLATLAAQEGAILAIAARNADRLEAAIADVKAVRSDAQVIAVPTDISKRPDCKRLVDQTIAKFGRVDALINSAYIGGAQGPVETADLDDWRRTFDVNLFGTLSLCQEVIPHMKAARKGAIVNINTQVVHKPLAGQSGYAASKGALATATSHLAIEVGKYGIRVNSVFMGWMWGPSVARYFEGVAKETGTTVEALRAGIAQTLALNIVPEDRECAKSALFLASDYASVVTGACLDVNGGDFIAR